MHCKASLQNATSDSDIIRLRTSAQGPRISHTLIDMKPDPLIAVPPGEIDIIAPCKLIDRTHNVTEKVTQVSARLWGPNVPTRIVKPEILDIVGTGLQSPRGKKIIKNCKWCLSESVTMQTAFL